MSRCRRSTGPWRDAVTLVLAALGLLSCSGGSSGEPAGDGGVEASADAAPDLAGDDVALPGECHFDAPSSSFDGSCQMVP